MYAIGWWLSRLAITFGAACTMTTIIRWEGYRCELRTMLVAAAILIIMIRTWAPGDKHDSQSQI